MGKVAAVYQRLKVKRLYRRLKKLKRIAYNARKVRDEFIAANPVGQGPSQAYWGKDYKTATDIQKYRRKGLQFSGAGDYKDFFRWGSRATGALVGGALGYMNGGWNNVYAGGLSGYNKGAEFSRFQGWGDYSANQIVAGGQQSQISVNSGDLSGDIVVARTEFVQNVVASGTTTSGFQINRFVLNPGLSGTFPWLSQIAQNFTLYEFEGLMFQYKPLFSENAGSAANLGKVIFCTQYDPDASDFITSIQMENYDYANSCKPADGLVHGVETDTSKQPLIQQYIRTGTTTRDKVFTDIGFLNVATEGIPLGSATSIIIGELWVTYRVKLSRAALYNSLLGYAIATDVLKGTTSAAALSTGTTFTKSTNAIGLTVTNVSSTAVTVSWPVNISLGSYMVLMEWKNVSGFTTQYVATVNNETNLLPWLPGSSLPAAGVMEPIPYLQTSTTVNGNICCFFFVTVNAPGLLQASIRINTSAALINSSTWVLYCQQANSLPSLALT